MKESTKMVDAVTLTEKALAEEIAKHDAVRDGPVENLIASHMDKRDDQWKLIISSLRSEMKGLKKSVIPKNIPGASSRVAPKKRVLSDDGPNAKRTKPSPPLTGKSKEHWKKSADKKNTAKQKRDHAAKKLSAPRKANPKGPSNPKGRDRYRVWRGSPRG